MMTIKKAALAFGGPLALAAVLGGTVAFAQSNGGEPPPSTDAAPSPGTHQRMKDDCPNLGGGNDSGDAEDSSTANQT